MPKLLVCPPHEGEPYSFQLQGKEIRVGRSSANDLVLADPWCSPSHALIYRVQEGYAVKDLGSKNGTCVNGHRIEKEITLNKDDEITLGATRLIVDCETMMPPPQPRWCTRIIEEAADNILSRMNEQDKDAVRKTKSDDLMSCHHAWEKGIRTDPDVCLMEIMQRVWQKLQKE